MITRTLRNDLVFDCYKNGAPIGLDFQETRRLLWESDLGYVVPTGWCHSHIIR